MIVLLIAAAVFAGLQISIKCFEVFDVSMLPTYKEGNIIAVNRLAYLTDKPKQGDIVALYPPGENCQSAFDRFFNPYAAHYIKRVIAKPGDTVRIDNHQVFINGTPLCESYIKERPDYTLPEQLIPDGKYFVLGDNRNNSYDSHKGWLVEQDEISGQVCFRFWSTEYPDIRYTSIPLFVIIVGVFSIDAILGSNKKNRLNQKISV
ncbi:MAG: signal peptidase I [Chloroflexi bacterium]|nr:signal peptidase I [Chloroflexota bacterium]